MKCCLLATVAFLLAFSPSWIDAETAGAADAVVIKTASAQPDFPDLVAFKLEAATQQVTNRVELLFSIAGVNTRYLAEPEISPAREIDLDFSLDMESRGIPPGVTITYDWRFVAPDGSSIESQPEAFVWIDHRFGWSELSSDQVTLHAYNGDPSFNREVLDSAQASIDDLEREFNLDQIAPVELWIYDKNSDYQGARLTNSETWSAAITFPELHLIHVVIPDGNHSERGRIVPHEISHQVLFQATENPFNYPATWLDEGLAVRNQANGNENDDEIVHAAAVNGRLLSLRSLNSSFPFDPGEADLAYAESHSAVNFIIAHFGKDRMGDLIRAYRSGLSHDEAFETAFGVDVDELDALWQESLDI
jgi:hypothetical protein